MTDDAEEKWWYWFRQTIPQPPGSWVLIGLFDSYEEATFRRERSKAWDAELSVVRAATRDDVKAMTPG